jgi:hypothetical protein
MKARVLYELVYPAAVYFEEVFKFYKLATESQIQEFERLVKSRDETGALNLMKRTLGII